MSEIKIEPSELRQMIADYMENGFLENIIDMFKYDNSLYFLVGELMTDERVRVRLGMSALVETLKKEDPENIHKSVPDILSQLKNPKPVVRGDAAYLLGIIGHKESIPMLEATANNDKSEDVRLIAKEAVEDIKNR
ncbi:MAG TPA: hypothetical protein DD713_02650 [Nitrospiraceae bacterium]|nr:hypothetical protein [Nitrospiraceae bacterium]